MCGRFVLTSSKEKIISSFEVDNSIDILNPRYNIYPTEKIPVILRSNGSNFLEIMQWGLFRFEVNINRPLINARVETIKQKPSFQKILKNPCLVPANGFYEWKKEKTKKQPYFISLKNIDLFAFAGIYDYGESNEGKNIKNLAILTTKSNSFLEKIHNRMPIILTEKNFKKWLYYPEIFLSDINNACKPLNMQTWEVSKKVNTPTFDNPICVKKIIKNEKLIEGEKFFKSQGSFFD